MIAPSSAWGHLLGAHCNCGPRFAIPCDQCEPGDDNIGPWNAALPCEIQLMDANDTGNPGCWKCEKGLVFVSREEAGARNGTVIVVHKMQT